MAEGYQTTDKTQRQPPMIENVSTLDTETDILLYINIDTDATQQINKLLTFTTIPNQPLNKIDLSTGNQIPFQRQVPAAYSIKDAKQHLLHNNTPVEPIPTYTELPQEIEEVVAASFSPSQQLTSPLPAPRKIFEDYFPNHPVVGDRAWVIFIDIEKYAKIHISLQIHLQLTQQILNNPAIILPASTGFYCQHLPTAMTSQYTSFGHTKEVNTAYCNLLSPYITNFNYVTKANAIIRHTQELQEIQNALITIVNQTPREWAALLTCPTYNNRPPLIDPTVTPPITIEPIHMMAAHTIIRDSVYYSKKGGVKLAQAVIDQYLIATNTK